jgi:hypothetical protein
MKVKRLKDKQINLSQVGKESQSSRSKVHNIKEFLRDTFYRYNLDKENNKY